MKTLSNSFRFLLFFAALGTLLITSCDPDPPLTDGPSISLVDDAGFVASSTTIPSGETFKVRVRGDKGTAEMNSLSIELDNSSLDAANFTIDGIAVSNNPQALVDGDRTSFTFDITITPHASGDGIYSFIVNSTDNTDAAVSVTITVEESDPSFAIDGPSSITLANPSFVEIDVNAMAGGSPLNTLSVFEDGDLITDASRLRFLAFGTEFGSNPLVLEGDNKSGFSGMIWLQSSSEIGTKEYTFTITDENDKEASFTYTITLEPLGTDFTMTFENVRIYNNSGPQPGAIDLETGTNVSSSNADADLLDDGIDGDGLWLQQISGLNGTEIVVLEMSQTYDGITTREELIAAYDAGTVASAVILETGSIFAAKKGDDYYLIQVANTVTTDSDNEDYFDFNIKQSLN